MYMENQLEKLIFEYLKLEQTTNRFQIFRFKEKLLDATDFSSACTKELGFSPKLEKIQSFSGYNTQKKIDSIIYNYDKRGWLYIELATRELFFIKASQYPYPQKMIDKRQFITNLKSWLCLVLLLVAIISVIYFLLKVAF